MIMMIIENIKTIFDFNETGFKEVCLLDKIVGKIILPYNLYICRSENNRRLVIIKRLNCSPGFEYFGEFQQILNRYNYTIPTCFIPI